MKLSKTLKPLMVGSGVLFFSIHCSNDTPVSSRFDLVGNNEVGKILQDSLRPPAVDSSAGRSVNTGASPLLQLGTNNNINSRILIRFSALPAGAIARSAELLLPTYRVLGSGADFEATVHRVTSDWAEVDDDSTGGVKHDNFKNAFDPAIVGSQMVAAADSDTVRIALNPTLVTGWIDSSIANFGLLIQAPTASFAKQFHARSSSLGQPLLRLTYTKNNADSTKDIRAGRDAFIFEVLQPPPAGPLYVSHGTDYRTLVKFDLSSFKPGTTVNRAQLTFTIDHSNSRMTADGMTLRLLSVSRDNLDPVSADSLAFLEAEKSVTDSTTVIAFEIRPTVQDWLRGSGDVQRRDNFGLVLLARDPDLDLQQISFYSTDTNRGLAPTLKIDYTLPPSAQ